MLFELDAPFLSAHNERQNQTFDMARHVFHDGWCSVITPKVSYCIPGFEKEMFTAALQERVHEERSFILQSLLFCHRIAPVLPVPTACSVCRGRPNPLGPIVGFVPVPFWHHLVYANPPPPELMRLWFWVAGIVFFALAILAVCKKPFGLLFALLTWASTIALYVRIYLRIKSSPPLFE